jgi:hypothetical protein
MGNRFKIRAEKVKRSQIDLCCGSLIIMSSPQNATAGFIPGKQKR